MSNNLSRFRKRGSIATYSCMTIQELHDLMLLNTEMGGESSSVEEAAAHRAEADIIDAIGAYMHGGDWHMLKQLEGTA